MVPHVSMRSLAARAGALLAVAVVLVGCGSAVKGSQAAEDSSRTCPQAVVATLGSVLQRVYKEGIASERTGAAKHIIQASVPLREAVSKGDPAVLRGFGFNGGDLVIVFNMALFGVYSACLRLRPVMHWISYMFIFAFVSTMFTIPFFMAEYLSGTIMEANITTFAMLAYAAIFPSLVANFAWNRGVEQIGANRAGAMLHLIALFSALLAGLFLGEHMLPYHFAGFSLIIVGVWVAARSP